MTTTTIHTASDLSALPDDGMRHELLHGDFRIMPPAGRKHGLVETAVLRALLQFVSERQLGIVTTGDTGYLISRDPDTVFAPDVGFIRAERAAAVTDDDTYWPLAPDLAVEILSPSDGAMDVEEKTNEWMNAGVKLLWILNPRLKTAAVHAPGRGPETLQFNQHLDGEDVLPGFRLGLAEIFR